MQIHGLTTLDFEKASAEQRIASLAPPTSDMPKSQMWTGRLVSMLGAVVPALVELRDIGYFSLDKDKLFEYLNLNNVVGLSQNPLLRDETRACLNAYLTSLPNFSLEGQSPATEMHHGFLTMRVSAILK